MTLVVIQARTDSCRLPAKIFADLAGAPLAQRLHERVRRAGYPVVWAVPWGPKDDELANFVKSLGAKVIRGPYHDVLSRLLKAADAYKATRIVRVTGDNPLTDPSLIRRLVKAHRQHLAQYTFTRDAPKGTRSEVVEVEALQSVRRRFAIREHLTWAFCTLPRQCEVFSCIGQADLRLTVDTPEDLARVQRIYEHFQGNPPSLHKVVQWIQGN